MAEKRRRDSDDHAVDRGSSKKQKRGFKVGPDHLPDGAYKRKTQKIKYDLIERAQIKKNYAKLKRQGKIPDESRQPTNVEQDADQAEAHEPTTTPHPDRQDLMNQEETSPPPQQRTREHGQRKRKPKSIPFQRHYEEAQKRRAEAEERRTAREEANRQRQLKIEERERFRKAMAKARRGGPNGQRKLGRESKPLLERVKRLVGEDG